PMTDEASGDHKLWQTAGSGGLDPLVEAYTVGSDFQDDQTLLGYDIQASLAHAKMLHSIKVLNDDELQQLTDALNQLLTDWKNDQFTIRPDQEDGHTAIEQYLVGKLG